MSVKLGSTAIKGIYLGANEIKKMYLGSNLVYQKSGYVDTEFTSCPFPTNWTEVTAGTKYNATNEYGEWNIWADNFCDDIVLGKRPTYLAFDRDNSTCWRSSEHSNGINSFEIGIDLPLKTLINPTSIFISSAYVGLITKVMGYNPLTDNWEDLGTIDSHSVAEDTNITITNNVFYSKFKLVMYRYSSKSKYNMVYEFQITSGTLRKES